MAQLRDALVWLLGQRTPGKTGYIEWSSVEIAALGQSTEHRAKMWLAMITAKGVVDLVREDADGTRWYCGSSIEAVRKWKATKGDAHKGGNDAAYVRERKIREAIEARITGRGPGVERAVLDDNPKAIAIVHRVESIDDIGWHGPETAARILRVHRETIYKWIRHGYLKAVRTGPRTLRIEAAELRRFLTPESPLRHVRHAHALREMVKELTHAAE